jgi:hypothetical protein
MADLYLYFCTVYSRKNQSASGLRKFEPADVSDCSGFIPQVLRDTLRYALRNAEYVYLSHPG